MPEEKFEVEGVTVTLTPRDDGYVSFTMTRGSAAVVFVVKDVDSLGDLKYIFKHQNAVFVKLLPKLAARVFLKKIGMVK